MFCWLVCEAVRRKRRDMSTPAWLKDSVSQSLSNSLSNSGNRHLTELIDVNTTAQNRLITRRIHKEERREKLEEY